MPRGEGITRMTLREVCNHARLRHPHIVAFRGVFLTRKYLALVMEVAQVYAHSHRNSHWAGRWVRYLQPLLCSEHWHLAAQEALGAGLLQSCNQSEHAMILGSDRSWALPDEANSVQAVSVPYVVVRQLPAATLTCPAVLQGGNLLSYVNQRGGLTESEARWLFQQEIIGLDYVHRKGVVVRDVKLENTLLDTSAKPLVKFCDFGFTKSREDSAPKTTLGTFGYTGVLTSSSVLAMLHCCIFHGSTIRA